MDQLLGPEQTTFFEKDEKSERIEITTNPVNLKTCKITTSPPCIKEKFQNILNEVLLN